MKRIFAWFTKKHILAMLLVVVLLAVVAMFSYQAGAQHKFRKGQRFYSAWGKSFEFEAIVEYKDDTDGNSKEEGTAKVTVDKLVLKATELKEPDEDEPYVYTATFSGKVDPKYSGCEIEIVLYRNSFFLGNTNIFLSTSIGEDGTFSIEETVERRFPLQVIAPAWITITQP